MAFGRPGDAVSRTGRRTNDTPSRRGASDHQRHPRKSTTDASDRPRAEIDRNGGLVMREVESTLTIPGQRTGDRDAIGECEEIEVRPSEDVAEIREIGHAGGALGPEIASIRPGYVVFRSGHRAGERAAGGAAADHVRHTREGATHAGDRRRAEIRRHHCRIRREVDRVGATSCQVTRQRGTTAEDEVVASRPCHNVPELGEGQAADIPRVGPGDVVGRTRRRAVKRPPRRRAANDVLHSRVRAHHPRHRARVDIERDSRRVGREVERIRVRAEI